MENKRDVLITNDNKFGYYQIEFAIVSKSAIFEEKKNQLCKALESEGFVAKEYKDINEIVFNDRNIFTCVIVFQPMQFSFPKNKRAFWIAIQTEQLYSKITGGEVFGRTHLENIIPYLKHYDALVDFSKYNIEEISKHSNITTYLCQLTQSPIIKEAESTNERKYDILFIGNMPGVNSRRKIIMDYLSKYYNVAPIRFDLWGDKKAEAINNSKICINLHYEEARYYESYRIDDYFSLGAFVLSEPMYSSGIFKDGEDYISFRLSNMCKKIDYYLEHSNEREEIAKHAQETIKANQSKEDKLLNLILDVAILESYRRQYQKENNRPFFVKVVEKTKNVISVILKHN